MTGNNDFGPTFPPLDPGDYGEDEKFTEGEDTLISSSSYPEAPFGTEDTREYEAEEPSSGLDPTPSRKIVIIGPTTSGKTSLLASSQRAALYPPIDRTFLDIDIASLNEETSALFREANQATRRGQIPVSATERITNYSFSLMVSTPDGSHGIGTRSFQVGLIDAPGGAIGMDRLHQANSDLAEIEQIQSLLKDQIYSAEALVICIDSERSRYGEDDSFFTALSGIITASPEYGSLPLRRVVFCLTKADRRFSNQGLDARQTIDRNNPMHIGKELIPRGVIRALQRSAPNVTIGYVWTSVYGFIKGQSNPNFDPTTGTLLEPAQWEPFQILDPLVFAATGNNRGLGVKVEASAETVSPPGPIVPQVPPPRKFPWLFCTIVLLVAGLSSTGFYLLSDQANSGDVSQLEVGAALLGFRVDPITISAGQDVRLTGKYSISLSGSNNLFNVIEEVSMVPVQGGPIKVLSETPQMRSIGTFDLDKVVRVKADLAPGEYSIMFHLIPQGPTRPFFQSKPARLEAGLTVQSGRPLERPQLKPVRVD